MKTYKDSGSSYVKMFISITTIIHELAKEASAEEGISMCLFVRKAVIGRLMFTDAFRRALNEKLKTAEKDIAYYDIKNALDVIDASKAEYYKAVEVMLKASRRYFTR